MSTLRNITYVFADDKRTLQLEENFGFEERARKMKTYLIIEFIAINCSLTLKYLKCCHW